MDTKKTHRIPPEIREQIMTRIKNDGVPASQAAEEHGVNQKTVYGWLSKEARIEGSVSVVQYNRLRRENEELLNIIGKLTVHCERSKKNPL